MRIISLPPPIAPLPVLVPIAVSVTALAIQNAHLIAEKLVLRYFQIPISLDNIFIEPLTRTVTLSKLKVFSPQDNGELLSINTAKARLQFQNGFFKTPVHIDVEADTMNITTTLFEDDRGRVSSNWTKLTKFYSSSSTESIPPSTGSDSHVPFSVKIDAPKLFIQTSSGHAITPLITIPKIYVTSDQLTSIAGASQFVDSLTTRVLDKFKPKAFRSEVRGVVRGWLRRSKVNDIVDEAIEWSKFNVGNFRSRLREFQTIADDLPGLEQVQSWTYKLDQYLGGAERFLRLKDTDQPTNTNDQHSHRNDRFSFFDRDSSPERRSAQPAPNSRQDDRTAPSITGEFRELDEEIP